jgi:MoxR-like ATPase
MMLRATRRSSRYPDDFQPAVEAGVMMKFMSTPARAAVSALLVESGISPDAESGVAAPPAAMVEIVPRERGRPNTPTAGLLQLRIGDITTPITPPQNPQLVPDVQFFEIPSHTLVLRSMLKDFLLGEHLLLMGPQGVGKNKLTDHFVKLLQREREYIQLHRDTTVPTLTVNPSLEDGNIVWLDSPLVRAMKHGRVLVIDEFDKAPVEVVCVLKNLLEDGEMLLADGRRFVTSRSALYEGARDPLAPSVEDDSESLVIRIDPGFQVIALANRPGYPFLGNDFFAEMGDVFACHPIDNPDQASEIAMLRAYAGDSVPASTIRRLTAAFLDLRKLSNDGQLAYPYSTRELVNVTRHMAMYPKDSMAAVLENIFAFDSFDGVLALFAGCCVGSFFEKQTPQ